MERYSSPARGRLVELIGEAKGDDLLAPVTVVVPTQYASLSLRRSLGAKGGLINVGFMTTARLAEYLGSPTLAEQGKAPLSSVMELATIQHLGSEMQAHGPLGGVARHPRLHSSLQGTFRDLASLSEAGLAGLEAEDSLREQMVRWYRQYRELLNHYYDREELSRVAAVAVKEGKAASVLKDLGFIIFHLVSDFTPGEIDLVNVLGDEKQCAVILGLTCESEADAKTKLTASRLQQTLHRVESTEELNQQSYSIDHMLIAPDAQEEIRWVVRHIAREAEGGLPFHRMAVLYRQSNPYGFLIHNQLRFAGIPVAGPDSTQLKDTPAGKLLTYLLAIIDSDFTRDSVMHWVAEAPVKTGSNSELASTECARWEAITREVGIVKGTTQWQERLDRYLDSLDERIDEIEKTEDASPWQIREMEKRRESANSLKLFVQELTSNYAPLGGSSWNAYAGWARGLLKKYTYQLTRWPEEHQSSYERVTTVLDELGALDNVVPGGTNLAEFSMMLNNSLEVPSGRTGATGSGVFVAPVSTAQAMDFDIVYIVGMAEGAFPPRVPDDPVLPDRIRKRLIDSESLPLRQSRRTEERRLFLAALASGQKRILSYPRADASSQRGQYPSPWFVKEAGRLHGKPVRSTEIEKLETEPWLSLIYSSQHSLEYSTTLAPADSHDYDMSSISIWHSRGEHIEHHFLMAEGSPGRRALDMEKGRQGSAFTAWDGRLLELARISRSLGLPQDSQFSPTRLQRWAECPFKYFLGDILGISALERPEEIMTISALDRGSLIHKVLEHFVKTTQEEGELPSFGEPWSQSQQELLMNIAEDEFDKAEASGLTGRHILWNLAKEEMRQDLMAFLESDSRWRAEERSRPLWVEREFGFASTGSLPPVILTRKNGSQVRLRGKMDRVDEAISGSRMIVMDYKSGSPYPYRDMKKDLLGSGRYLQLPVYAQAVRSAAGKEMEVEALYWFVTTRGGFDRKSVPLAEVEDRFHEVVEIIASGIEQGIFPANPGSPDGQQENCRYCDFKRICPANVDLLWERKLQNPEIAHYLKLSGVESSEEVEE